MNSILKLILNNYKKQPQNIAIDDEDSSFSWKELIDYSKAIAKKLQNNNIKKQDCVSIELPNCKEFIASIIACQMVGAIYVPVGVSYPKNRVLFIREDCNIKVVINQEFLKTLDLNNIIDFQPCEKKDDDIEMIIYTSGSTGNPKGVVHTVNSLLYTDIECWQNKFTNLTPNDRFGLAVSLTFMYGINVAFGILTANIDKITLIIFGKKVFGESGLFEEICVNKRVNKIAMGTSLLSNVNYDKTLLEKIFIAGSIANELYIECKELYNVYGATEFGGAISISHIEKYQSYASIGNSIPSYNFYIINEKYEQVDRGELCVTGPIAKEYYKMPEETKKVFVSNPFSKYDGHEIMYKTGDIAFRNSDKCVCIVGRKDLMVKINDQRVQLEEIESTIKKMDGVKNAFIKYFEQYNMLCAYYISDVSFQKKDLDTFLLNYLPEYMIPKNYIRIDKVPLNTNGKIDRSLLEDPLEKIHVKDSDKPHLKMQIDLAKIISNVLNVDYDNIGINTNLKTLGLNSITAINLSLEYKKEICENISAADLLNNSTIEDHIKILHSNKKFENIVLYNKSIDKSKRTLFFVHTAQTGSESYRNLAKRLQDDVNFACLENYNLYHIDNPICSIKELANRYAKHIMNLQPNGTYFIGGWCYGGIIAYEIAREIKKLSDNSTINLILLDSSFKQFDLTSQEIQSVINSFVEYLSNNPQWIAEDLNTENISNTMKDNYLKLTKISFDTLLRYIPSAFDDNVLLVDAKNTEIGNPLFEIFKRNNISDELRNKLKIKMECNNFLDNYCKGNVTQVTVNTNHNTMMNDEVIDDIANAIRGFINNLSL